MNASTLPLVCWAWRSSPVGEAVNIRHPASGAGVAAYAPRRFPVGLIVLATGASGRAATWIGSDAMKRTLISGGQVFDGSGAAPVTADVVVEGERIVALGSGLDGDEVVDATGQTVVPGLFDCHTHVMMSGVDVLKSLSRPFSLPF